MYASRPASADASISHTNDLARDLRYSPHGWFRHCSNEPHATCIPNPPDGTTLPQASNFRVTSPAQTSKLHRQILVAIKNSFCQFLSTPIPFAIHGCNSVMLLHRRRVVPLFHRVHRHRVVRRHVDKWSSEREAQILNLHRLLQQPHTCRHQRYLIHECHEHDAAAS